MTDTLTLDWTQAAQDDGADAWHAGVSADGNPFDPDTNADLHSWWHTGWAAARRADLGGA